jgi:hypothetical protein
MWAGSACIGLSRRLSSSRRPPAACLLQALLSSAGEPFTKEEAAALERFAADSQGLVHCEGLAFQLANSGRK